MIGNSKGGDVTPEGSTLGPLFVIVFTLLTTLLLLNMFVAVLVHAFSKVCVDVNGGVCVCVCVCVGTCVGV